MITTHYIVRCDYPDCLEEFIGPPLDLGPIPPGLDRTLAQAAQSGWLRLRPLAADQVTRHLCPVHADPETDRSPAIQPRIPGINLTESSNEGN